VLKHDATYTATVWGQSGDVPQVADFNGDGITDVTVYRPSTGTWFVLPSDGGPYTATAWGISTDVPVTLPASIRSSVGP
jgi:hypothetical protein